MHQSDSHTLIAAYGFWSNGDALESGKLIFESLPARDRPKWASKILKFAIDRVGVDSSIFDQTLNVAENERLWRRAHENFDNLRDVTLKLNELRDSIGLSEDQEKLALVLSLAELVAKVTYNSTDPPDGFDDDSGWWIAPCLKALVDHTLNDERIAEDAWLCMTES